MGASKLVRPKTAVINGNTTTRATASPAPAMAQIVKNSDTTLSHMNPRFSFLVIDDVEGIEDRPHARIGAPQRDSKPQKEAEGELAIALCRDARYLLG